MFVQSTLDQVVVCKNPSDYPGKYTARVWTIHRDGTATCAEHPLHVCDDIRTIRADMYAQGRVCLARSAEDDPVIVETWI